MRQNPGERNFHIFYAMLEGTDDAEKKQFRLGDPTTFHYLNQSGCTSDTTIDDKGDFQRVSRGSDDHFNF